jgi:Putative MetA-pathway of phenol degradation
MTYILRKGASLFLILAMNNASMADSEMAPGGAEPNQTIDDAWWTGPLLAASPATLPPGHFLVEPYVYDSMVDGQFDSVGDRHRTPRDSAFGSQSYVLYGLTDRVTIGAIPRIAYSEPSQGQGSSTIGIGDLTAQAAYRLSRFLDAGWLPAMSVVLGETLPTGRYDRLGDRAGDGLGAGAYTTILSLYTQYYLWMPNGRLLRSRLDVSQSWSDEVQLRDTSVYGTPAGFRGYARPANSLTIDSAWEYSMTQRWVTALDVVFDTAGSTQVAGIHPQSQNGGLTGAPIQSGSGSTRSLGLAPAVEYNWSANAGVIVGVKFVAAGHNTAAALIPIAAINLVF